MTHSSAKDPSAPAAPNARRLPHPRAYPMLAGQPALVTGANSGIGKAVALGLSRRRPGAFFLHWNTGRPSEPRLSPNTL